MYIALYINCIHGKFEPVGPFEKQSEAYKFTMTQDDPALWSVFKVKNPDQSLHSVRADLH